jgi:hypothetical protein
LACTGGTEVALLLPLLLLGGVAATFILWGGSEEDGEEVAELDGVGVSFTL